MLHPVQENGKNITVSPSEPLIEASAQIMNFSVEKPCQWNKKLHMDLWDLLGQLINQNLAAESTIGDLLNRSRSQYFCDGLCDPWALEGPSL